MESFEIYQKKGNGSTDSITIADLIPFGRDNAISRSALVTKCVENGLIAESVTYKDRAMRNLISRAKADYVIQARCGEDGGGYYRPTHEDLLDLQRYIRQEEKRGKAVFRNIQLARKLYEDYRQERITT